MIRIAQQSEHRRWAIGAALGVYASAAALIPGAYTKAILCAPLLVLPLAWYLLSTSTAWLSLFFICSLLTPPLPIALGDSGPNVALLFAAAGLFTGFLRGRQWRLRVDALTCWMVALFLVFLASVSVAAVNSGAEIAAGSLARVLLFGIPVYVFLYARDGPARVGGPFAFRMLRILFWVACLSALFACVDFYYQFPAPAGFEQQFIWLESGIYRRAQGVFYEASTLGNLCAFFLEMIALALFRRIGGQPFSRLSLLFGAGIFSAALVLSYSRASLLNLAVALLALLWLDRRQIKWRRLLIGSALLSVGGAAVLYAAFPSFANVAWLRVSAAFQYFSESPNAILSGRLQSWSTLIDYLLAHPWRVLFGVGYKTLPYSNFIGVKLAGDNTYLTVLVETGVLGLLAVIGLNAAILITGLRAARSFDPLRSFCGVWIFCFWAGQSVQMLSADLLTYWRVLPVYFFVLALAAREVA